MKKVLAALVMVLGTGSSVVFAQEVNNSSAIVAEAQVPQDEFVKIDPTELPQAVMQTLAKDYEGASVKEAYVNGRDHTLQNHHRHPRRSGSGNAFKRKRRNCQRIVFSKCKSH